MPKLIVSLTTIPSRVRYLEEFSRSLLRQTVSPDRIELNLPHEYKRRKFTDLELAQVPSCFDVHRCDDVGPATKLLPTLKRYWESDAVIIYCDDDRVYSEDWIERFLRYAEENPSCAIADECLPIESVRVSRLGATRDWKYRLKRAASLGVYRPYHFDGTKFPDIAEGFGGVLVRPDFFNERVFDVPDQCWPVDDVWLSANIRSSGHEIVRYPRNLQQRSYPLKIEGEDVGRLGDSLTQTKVDGQGRASLNFHAVKYCMENLGVWPEYSKGFAQL